MKWHEGGIPAAIQAAKNNKSVFIVLVADDTEASASMEEHLHHGDVTSLCEGKGVVAVKLQGGSNDCKFFSQIYPVVVIPSTFFIAHSGTPLEVVGEVKGHDDFLNKVKAALEMQDKLVQEQQSISASSSQTVAAGPSSEPSSSQPKEAEQTDEVSLEEKVERAKELVELTKEQKAKKEAELAKQKEFERRQIGQGVQKLRQQQREQEIKEAAKEYRKNKDEDKIARQRVKEEIARDRAEKAERNKQLKEERSLAQEEERKRRLAEQQAAQQAEQSRRSNEARLQFRKPDGSSITHTFPATDTFATVHSFITEHMGCTVTLSTTFPRRTFTSDDHQSTLQDLGLAPSAAILVMMGSGSSGGVKSSSDVSMLYSVFSMVLSPIWFVWNTLAGLLGFGGNSGSSSQPTSRAQGATGGDRRQDAQAAYRRKPGSSSSTQSGNIHRLRNADDDDDENNTWNGNSTQQM